MKTSCEGCGTALPPDCEAYTCSFECTFCPQCYSTKQKTCPNCGGELVRRPRRATSSPEKTPRPFAIAREMPRIWLIFAIVSEYGFSLRWRRHSQSGSSTARPKCP